MAVARIWNGSDWIPVAGGSGLDVPSNIASGHGVVYNGNGQWIPQRLATEQMLDDLRDEFEGHHHDTRYSKRIGRIALSQGVSTALGAGSNLGSLGSMTIRGDGRRRVHLRANFSHVAASATTNLAVQIWLSSVGAGINVGGNELQYGYMYNPGGVYLPLFCEVELDPFTGTKDIHVTIHTTGAATVTTANPSDTGAAASPDAQSLASHSLIAEWIN